MFFLFVCLFLNIAKCQNGCLTSSGSSLHETPSLFPKLFLSVLLRNSLDLVLRERKPEPLESAFDDCGSRSSPDTCMFSLILHVSFDKSIARWAGGFIDWSTIQPHVMSASLISLNREGDAALCHQTTEQLLSPQAVRPIRTSSALPP